MGVQPRSCGVLTDCLLYLAIWGEAANLRHMPELLCWIYHRSQSFHQAIVSKDGDAGPRAAAQSMLSGRQESEGSSPSGPTARASRVTFSDAAMPPSAAAVAAAAAAAGDTPARGRTRTASGDAIRLVPGANMALEHISERSDALPSSMGSTADLAALAPDDAQDGPTINVLGALVEPEGDEPEASGAAGGSAAAEGAELGAEDAATRTPSLPSNGSALLDLLDPDDTPDAACMSGAAAAAQRAWLSQQEARIASAAEDASGAPTPPPSPPTAAGASPNAARVSHAVSPAEERELEDRSCAGVGVVCDDFLRRVVRPLYEIASQRMRAPVQPLTYDDINECAPPEPPRAPPRAASGAVCS